MELNQINFRDTPKYRLGQTGELIIAKLLQEKGWYVIPSYDYSGEDKDKAPRLQGMIVSYVLPDLDICKSGERRWAEVKTKTEATFYRFLKRYEHGMPLRHFSDYQKIQEITGATVWLFVYEEKTGEILFAELDELEKVKRIYTGGKMSLGGMIFFPRECFSLFGRLSTNYLRK